MSCSGTPPTEERPALINDGKNVDIGKTGCSLGEPGWWLRLLYHAQSYPWYLLKKGIQTSDSTYREVSRSELLGVENEGQCG